MTVTLTDAPQFDSANIVSEDNRMAQTSPLMQEVVRKIASHFVASGFDDFDEVLSTLFMKPNA